MEGFFIVCLAIFGIIQLPSTIRMAIACSRIYHFFANAGYPELSIKRISINTGYTADEIVTACIADKRMESVVPGTYEVWTVAKQYRI